MRIGTIKQIWRYAVKSMAGEQLEACTVGLNGIPGDRGWALRDDTGKITSGSRIPLLMQCSAYYREAPANGFIPHVDILFPDGLQLGSDLSNINVRLTELLGKAVSLCSLQPASNSEVVQAPNHFDAFPIHVLTTASLEMMTRLNPEAKWDVRRFRPNFLVETDSGIKGLVEFEWSRVRLGNLEIRCEIPTERCAMAIQAQANIPKDPSILKTIVKEANQNLGVYASVIKAGEVRIGDVVEIY